MTKWYPFDPDKGYRQKRPEDFKWVLVKTRSRGPGLPDPISVGYIKYAAGDRSCPYFVCPGVGGTAMAWCDCLPDDYAETRPKASITVPAPVEGERFVTPHPYPYRTFPVARQTHGNTQD